MSVCGVPPTARVSRHELIRHRVALLTPANGDVADAWEPDLAWLRGHAESRSHPTGATDSRRHGRERPAGPALLNDGIERQ
jgi:hypothetical protein